MKQLVKAFTHRYHGEGGPLDTQINEFISSHEGHKIANIGYVIGGNFEKALVTFDVREPNDIYNKKENRNHE